MSFGRKKFPTEAIWLRWLINERRLLGVSPGPMWVSDTWLPHFILVPHLVIGPHGILGPLRDRGGVALVVGVRLVQQEHTTSQERIGAHPVKINRLLSHNGLLVVDPTFPELLILHLGVRNYLIQVACLFKVVQESIRRIDFVLPLASHLVSLIKVLELLFGVYYQGALPPFLLLLHAVSHSDEVALTVGLRHNKNY